MLHEENDSLRHHHNKVGYRSFGMPVNIMFGSFSSNCSKGSHLRIYSYRLSFHALPAGLMLCCYGWSLLHLQRKPSTRCFQPASCLSQYSRHRPDFQITSFVTSTQLTLYYFTLDFPRTHPCYKNQYGMVNFYVTSNNTTHEQINVKTITPQKYRAITKKLVSCLFYLSDYINTGLKSELGRTQAFRTQSREFDSQSR